jgi:hypothetical protein
MMISVLKETVDVGYYRPWTILPFLLKQFWVSLTIYLALVALLPNFWDIFRPQMPAHESSLYRVICISAMLVLLFPLGDCVGALVKTGKVIGWETLLKPAFEHVFGKDQSLATI